MFKHILIDLSLSSEQECELKSDNFDLILTYECETHMFNVLRGFEINNSDFFFHFLEL